MNTEKRLFKGKLKQYSLLIALVIIIAFFQIVTGGLGRSSGLVVGL